MIRNRTLVKIPWAHLLWVMCVGSMMLIGSFVLGSFVVVAAQQPIECPPKGFCIDGHVVRVIDGDTVVVQSTVEYHVRLLDCWAPESRTKDVDEKTKGLKSKARMTELASGKQCRVFMPSAGSVTDMITMGRILGRVWLMENGQPAVADLSSVMVSENLATTTKRVAK